ncbi:hypothetical protein [Kiloniella majae]|uniref:hypothetical protein n=1 Tax=Kiloniella majae TaxID=1938558 RepID=UPI000A277673|nr:hypothetical protein [Kiloniella majae]
MFGNNRVHKIGIFNQLILKILLRVSLIIIICFFVGFAAATTSYIHDIALFKDLKSIQNDTETIIKDLSGTISIQNGDISELQNAIYSARTKLHYYKLHDSSNTAVCRKGLCKKNLQKLIKDLEFTAKEITRYRKNNITKITKLEVDIKKLITKTSTIEKEYNTTLNTIYMNIKEIFIWIGIWPVFFTLLSTFIFYILSQEEVRKLFSDLSLTKVGIATPFFQAELTYDAAKRKINHAKEVIEKETNLQYKNAIASVDLNNEFHLLCYKIWETILPEHNKLSSQKPLEFQATLHVPGFLETDGEHEDLVQAIEYVKISNNRDYVLSSEGKAGRRFSVRYGIIGKAWRLRAAIYNHEVKGKLPIQLIRHWGLLKKEADNQSDSSSSTGSLLALIIPQKYDHKIVDNTFQHNPIGIIFITADYKNAFGNPEGLNSQNIQYPGDILAKQYQEQIITLEQFKNLQEKIISLQKQMNHHD